MGLRECGEACRDGGDARAFERALGTRLSRGKRDKHGAAHNSQILRAATVLLQRIARGRHRASPAAEAYSRRDRGRERIGLSARRPHR